MQPRPIAARMLQRQAIWELCALCPDEPLLQPFDGFGQARHRPRADVLVTLGLEQSLPRRGFVVVADCWRWWFGCAGSSRLSSS